MTRKDYERIAAILRNYHDDIGSNIHACLVHDFASMLQAANPRFDRERFERAADPTTA